MGDRLYQYVFLDNKARHNGDRLSLLIAFAGYLIGLFAFKASLQIALWGALMVLLLCTAATTLWYCVKCPTVSLKRS